MNGSLPGYTFEFEPTTSTHGGVAFFINDSLCCKVRNDLKMLFYGRLESIFLEIGFDKKKKNIIGLIYWHPICWLMIFVIFFLIECLNKIYLLDNTWILMCDADIDLLKLHANNVTSKFLEVMTSCVFVSHIQQPIRVIGSSTILIDNIFI